MNKALRQIARSQKKKAQARFYNVNSILGNDWAMFYVILGSRMTGKSYAITDYLCRQKAKKKDKVKNYWLRISETSTKAMLANKAQKLVDPDLVRKYNLDLSTKGMEVYNHKEPFMSVIPLSQFAKLKGVGFYDKDYDGEYNIVLDEFQLEQGERRTSFSILYNFIGMCENIARTTKKKIRVFLIGNTLEEASGILKAFEFLPEKFGRYYLKSKRCIIDYIENTTEYEKDREGSIADILGGKKMSNYTNMREKSLAMITKERIHRPTSIIRFSKEPGHWYTVYDGVIVRPYRGESVHESNIIAMRPHLNTYYSRERMMGVVEQYDIQYFRFQNLIDQAYFEEELSFIRKV